MLLPLDYHQTTTNYFQQQTKTWDFFSGFKHREEQLTNFKIDLLKNTYKFDESVEVSLYQKVNLAKEKLNLSLPVTLYQAQNIDEMNSSIIYIDGEAHIVFSGRLLQFLNDDEIQAVIAHELSHILLYTQINGSIEVTDRIVTAIANHQDSTPAHYETARLFKLYTEIFCDRGAYVVTENYAPIISSLVKISTGLQTVNADSYIKQTEEIFSSDAATKTSGISHPENFIRARALWLWHTKGTASENTIREMIEGAVNIDELDLFAQQRISMVTEQMVRLLLHPHWMQTAQTVALAKQYFGSIQLSGEEPDKVKMVTAIESLHGNLHDYLAYILYDFATADKSLEDVPLGYGFYLADELKIEKPFANAIKKEKKLSDKKVSTLKKQTLAEYHKQSETALQSIE